MSKFSSLIRPSQTTKKKSTFTSHDNATNALKRRHNDDENTLETTKKRKMDIITIDDDDEDDYYSDDINYDSDSSNNDNAIHNSNVCNTNDNQLAPDPYQMITRTKNYDNLEFLLSFKHPQVFKQTFTLVAAIIPQCHFCIEINDNFRGISINTIDGSQICVVVAKIACEVYVNSSEVLGKLYSIDFDLLTKSLSNGIDPSKTVDIKKLHNDEEVAFEAYDEEWSIDCLDFSLKLSMPDTQPGPRFEYKCNITVDMESVNELKHLIKLGTLYEAKSMRFIIYKPCIMDDGEMHKKIHYFLRIVIEGQRGKASRTFHASYNWKMDNDVNITLTTPKNQASEIDENKLLFDTIHLTTENEIYNNSFSVDFLHKITKPMSDAKITFHFCIKKSKITWNKESQSDCDSFLPEHNTSENDDDDSEDSDDNNVKKDDNNVKKNILEILDKGTLVMNYQVGSESYVRYMLARQLEEETQE